MNSVGSIGKLLMLVGVVLLVLGAVLTFIGRIPGVGRLPGDIVIKRGNFTFFFPVTTCIILSIILSLLFALFSRR
ncbi:MAG TPA: DUF2905 domain-containing protein [Bacillota bacterium]|nr:DUF2905 domain-containing protein [Bacillota bacterium]